MSRRIADDDDWPDDDSYGPHDEWDDEEIDVENPNEDEPTITCPYCRRQIHEESSRCPYCKQYISTVDAPRLPKPWWLIVGVIACLYVMLRWIFW